MNYQRIYEQLTAKDMIADYTEEHHIIPDCFFINRKRKGPKGHLEGNPNDPSNIVRLTPEAHYVAHQLLVKIYPDNHKLVYAALMMTAACNGQRVNNKLYGWLRRKLSETMKGKRNVVSAETRAKISVAKKGKPQTPEHTAKIANANRNSIRKPLSNETRSKISSAKKGKPGHSIGKPRSTETRSKIREARLNKPQLKTVCPHCNKTGGISLMTRYHFDNCKSLLQT